MLAFNARYLIRGFRSINTGVTFWKDLINAGPRLQKVVLVISGVEEWYIHNMHVHVPLEPTLAAAPEPLA